MILNIFSIIFIYISVDLSLNIFIPKLWKKQGYELDWYQRVVLSALCIILSLMIKKI